MSLPDPAAGARDRGIRRARRATLVIAGASVALGAATAGVAAMTLPGRSTQQPEAGSDQGAQQQPAGSGSQAGQQDGLQAPAQAPQAPQDPGPLVITGGS